MRKKKPVILLIALRLKIPTLFNIQSCLIVRTDFRKHLIRACGLVEQGLLRFNSIPSVVLLINTVMFL